ncbi:hypothetical protein DTO207G8_393 [Paecilomyces variotii]|nr:hypothetical protein DTO032I3_4894 [Paecilomyces variotii]KAJ9260348.1 hypothetical protein DTO207G8_393 [Paecilomyces variotii]KAJ9277096.1 hypothetical protein DTO021D3_5993 [Paecilomyces variotii]KAJ9346366.1 hypothetical protein DTO027B6_1219 [Paecilomyces variotii]KAJ9350718.1 hypothetical protein DTO027B9_6742 [Paecilomyces variotii]
MDTGPRLRPGWDENLTTTAGPLTSRPPDATMKSDLSALLLASTSADQSPQGKMLPSLPGIFDIDRGAFASARRRPHSAAELEHLQQREGDFPSPVGPSPKRPRLSYDYELEASAQGMDPMNKTILSREGTMRCDSSRPNALGDGTNRSQSMFSMRKIIESRHDTSHQCLECALVKPLLQKVLSEVDSLESELQRASPLRHGHFARQTYDSQGPSGGSGQPDVEKQLKWAATVIERCTTFVGGLTVSRSQPVLPSGNPPASSVQPQISSMLETTSSENPKKRLVNQDLDKSDVHRRHSVPTRHDTRSNEQSFAMSREGANTPFSDAYSQPGLRSPHGLLSSPAPLARLQSPSQTGMSRMLPSPSSVNLPPTSAQIHPLGPSPGWSVSAHTSHLQDLQHQVSTKTLAIQTLQREHDNLLAAYSRQQTRCIALDKKTKVSDSEIKALTEEKMKLQKRAEELETQVEDLAKTKEEAHQQSATSGAQYMQILAMSSRLQSQSAADLRRFKLEREEWERQKKELLQRIEELGSLKHVLTDVRHSATEHDLSTETLEIHRVPISPSYHTDADDILATTSLDVLRKEVLRLRRRCQEMEGALKGLDDEAEHFSGALQQAMNLSDRIRSRAQAVLGLQRPGTGAEKEEPSTRSGMIDSER